MDAAQQLDIAGAKGGSSKPKTPVEAPDSLQSTNIASILLAVGEGEFDEEPTNRDIYIDNTPIMDASGSVNFPGVRWEWRPGSVEQDYIQGIPAIENETTVNVELRSDNRRTQSSAPVTTMPLPPSQVAVPGPRSVGSIATPEIKKARWEASLIERQGCSDNLQRLEHATYDNLNRGIFGYLFQVLLQLSWKNRPRGRPGLSWLGRGVVKLQPLSLLFAQQLGLGGKASSGLLWASITTWHCFIYFRRGGRTIATLALFPYPSIGGFVYVASCLNPACMLSAFAITRTLRRKVVDYRIGSQ